MQLTFNEFDNSPGGHQDTREQDNLFLTPEHRGTYEEYLRRDKTNKQDRERKALFFILSGCKDLQSKSVQRIYDFQEHMLQFSPDEELMEKYLQQFSLCSSSRALLLLAVNLYSGLYKSQTVNDTFYNLDEDNIQLAINSMRIRFDRNVHI